MEVKILKAEKNLIEVEFPELTMAEILRVYLNKDSDVTFAAWKREHMTVNPVLKVETKDKDAKVVLDNAVKAITADLDEVAKDFKAMK